MTDEILTEGACPAMRGDVRVGQVNIRNQANLRMRGEV